MVENLGIRKKYFRILKHDETVQVIITSCHANALTDMYIGCNHTSIAYCNAKVVGL